MNDKIRIIKEKAITESDKNNTSTTDFPWELFAEMLIKECATVVRNTGTQCAFTTYDLVTVKCTIDKCAETLENYFKE
jgi:hypothetical protein